MADKTRKVDHYSIQISDKAGEGARLLEQFRDAGINLIALWGYSIGGGKARVEMIPEDGRAYAAAAAKAGLHVGERRTAFFVTGVDRQGAIAQALGRLSRAGVSVSALQAVSDGAGQFGAVIFLAEADIEKAGTALNG